MHSTEYLLFIKSNYIAGIRFQLSQLILPMQSSTLMAQSVPSHPSLQSHRCSFHRSTQKAVTGQGVWVAHVHRVTACLDIEATDRQPRLRVGDGQVLKPLTVDCWVTDAALEKHVSRGPYVIED